MSDAGVIKYYQGDSALGVLKEMLKDVQAFDGTFTYVTSGTIFNVLITNQNRRIFGGSLYFDGITAAEFVKETK